MIGDVLANRTPWHIETGDVLDVLRAIPDESVHCVVTSPPYWGLRDYGVDGQIGLEDSVEAWVARMVEVFREVRRVLRSDGTCWVNLGDSYANNGVGQGCVFDAGRNDGRKSYDSDAVRGRKGVPYRVPPGLKAKDLIGQPWRVAFALQADGWWLRQDIVWHKPNPMPESVTDRCTKAHEYVFLLTKSARYFYDAEAVREGVTGGTHARRSDGAPTPKAHRYAEHAQPGKGRMSGPHSLSSRNARSVWTINPQPFPEAHFATFPEALPERCILAGTSAKGCCQTCGAPWVRVVEREGSTSRAVGKAEAKRRVGLVTAFSGYADGSKSPTSRTTGWRPSCGCEPADPIPCIVLDPFNGAGTTGVVAFRLGRRYLGAELNSEYADMARRRINATDPFAPKPVGDNGAQQGSLFR